MTEHDDGAFKLPDRRPLADAEWENGYVGDTVYKDKNIRKNVSNYILSWPDGRTGTTWTVKNGDTTTGSYFTFILNSICENYKNTTSTSYLICGDNQSILLDTGCGIGRMKKLIFFLCFSFFFRSSIAAYLSASNKKLKNAFDG